MTFRHDGVRYKITGEMEAALLLQPRLQPDNVFALLCEKCRQGCIGYAPLAGSPAYAPCDCCAIRDRYKRAKDGASGPPPSEVHHRIPLETLRAVVA